MSDLVAAAEQLARTRHAGQVDKQGRPYADAHLAAVAANLRIFGPYAEAAGWLHDLIEDTSANRQTLIEAGMPRIVIDAVWSVTRQDDETYATLIGRAAAHPLGRLVKLADNWVNLTGLDDLARADPKTAARLRRRYEAARSALLMSIGAMTPGGTDMTTSIVIVSQDQAREILAALTPIQGAAQIAPGSSPDRTIVTLTAAAIAYLQEPSAPSEPIRVVGNSLHVNGEHFPIEDGSIFDRARTPEELEARIAAYGTATATTPTDYEVRWTTESGDYRVREFADKTEAETFGAGLRARTTAQEPIMGVQDYLPAMYESYRP